MVNFEARPFQSFDHLEPLRPVRVDQNINVMSLNKKRGVADPGDANLAFTSFGNCGGVWPPERLTKSEGIRTLVRKLRLCQSARGRNRTRVERFVGAPSRDVWRTTFRRLFFEKRIGTFAQAYKLAPAKQNLLPDCGNMPVVIDAVD